MFHKHWSSQLLRWSYYLIHPTSCFPFVTLLWFLTSFSLPAREKFLLSTHRSYQIREIAEKLNWSLPLFLCSHIIWRWIQKCSWRTWHSQNSQVCKTWFWVEICTIANVFNNVTPIAVWIHLWNLTGVTAKWFSVEKSAENSPPIASIWVEIVDEVSG